MVGAEGVAAALAGTDRGVLVVDGGRIELANDALCRLFDLPRDRSWDGRPFAEFVDALAPAVRDEARFRDGLADARGHVAEDIPMRDGRVLERDHLPVLAGDVVTGRIELFRDVSERPAVQPARLLTAHEPDLLATARHELRTPLTSILGFSEMLAGGLDADQTRRYAGIVHRNARSLLQVVDDLLLMAALDSPTYRLAHVACVVDQLIGEVVTQLRPLAQAAGVTVRLDCADALAVDGDRGALVRAVSDIVENAINYSDRGGSVDVTATEDRDEVRIDVRDHGIGIPDDEVEQVFSQFFRASTARETGRHGTGLGLALARSIVTRHGGSIALRTAAGAGTTVSFRLPSARGYEGR